MGRVGDSLHKALVPLDDRALLSHLFDLAPAGARLIVCVGYRADQVKDYVRLAHPSLDVTFVDVDDWDQPGAGPGASLLAARHVVGHDKMILTSCDTLWNHDPALWEATRSWAAVAPVPAGTAPERWCRMAVDAEGVVTRVLDKQPWLGDGSLAYVGLACVQPSEIDSFWRGVANGDLVGRERQVTGGLARLVDSGSLLGVRVGWTDVGDEDAYRRAVAAFSGYDWTKTDEATYVLPREGRVVKFWADEAVLRERADRAWMLNGTIPRLVSRRGTMLAYEFIEGTTCYPTAETDDTLVPRLLDWAADKIWKPANVPAQERVDACTEFYLRKTADRVARLRPDLRDMATDALRRVRWDGLADGCEPVIFHGDFNFGNVIDTGAGFVGIDWRQDFAGHLEWGDRRYDLAKIIGGCVVHWDRARRGDFRLWAGGVTHMNAVYRWLGGPRDDVAIIAGLTLLSSAPLHAAPLDEVLVARGVTLLEGLT